MTPAEHASLIEPFAREMALEIQEHTSSGDREEGVMPMWEALYLWAT